MRLALAVLLVVAAAAPAGAQQKARSSSEARERINKVWDERLQRMLHARIEAGCKAEAKRNYSAIRFNKRRMFVDECIERATAAAAQAAHPVN